MGGRGGQLMLLSIRGCHSWASIPVIALSPSYCGLLSDSARVLLKPGLYRRAYGGQHVCFRPIWWSICSKQETIEEAVEDEQCCVAWNAPLWTFAMFWQALLPET